jgi:murein DD-endopeptidase MepM/ murein hydrolase activator NlpD
VSIYCHLSEISVEDGAFLHKGELLGLSGSSGRVTGPHLHLGMSIKGQKMDPMTLFSGNFGDEKDNLLQVF